MSAARVALESSLRHPLLDEHDPAHEGPLVTMVVVTRDGLHHLQRLFAGLAENTRYRSFEVVVVDNQSTDGSLAWLEQDHGFPVEVIRNDHNASFSDANNQGIAVARGDYLLILNNDVEPIGPDWLTRLVTPLREDPTVAATGPLLIYPERTPPPGETFHFPDLTVQHAGVMFEVNNGRVRARNVAAGDDPLRPGLRTTRPVAALTAACLLARTADLRAIGGFDSAYFYGSEDWDLSLRLARRGSLQLVGRSVLYHYEYGTQNTFESAERAAYRRRNHVEFNGRWGAAVRRQLLLEHLGGEGGLIADTPSTYLLDPPEDPLLQRLGAELEALGWEPHVEGRHPPVLELALVGHASPARSGAMLTVAVTRANLDAGPPSRASLLVGLDGRRPLDADTPTAVIRAGRRVLGGDGQSLVGVVGIDLLEQVAAFVARPRFALRNCAPDPEKGATWGDTHFAASFAAALARAGYEAHQHTVVEWEEARAYPYDVVVHLRGLKRYETRPGATNVCWIISHPEDVTDEELADYDLVLVASGPYAEKLRARTDVPVHVMHQATDPTRFHPPVRDLHQAAHGVVVAANARWPFRRGPRWLMELGRDFELYGANWERFPEHDHVVSSYVSNEQLADVYATADVVVADQWDHMAREGFVANRLFDVAAAGGFVVSDDGPGVHEVFGDLIPTFASRAELDAVLTRYLDDPDERDRRAYEAMKLVRREHTFDARVNQLLSLLRFGQA